MPTWRRVREDPERDDNGTGVEADDRPLRSPIPTTQFPPVFRAYVELSMVLTGANVVAVLERLYLEGWADAERRLSEGEDSDEEGQDPRGEDLRECEG